MRKFPNTPRVLKAKLVSYEIFSGIAHSIQLVAFSKLKKLKKKIDTRFVSLKFVKSLLKNYYSIESNNSYKYCLVIPFTSDKSCCGSINNPILNKTIKFLNTLKSLGIIVSIAPVGRKGYYILRKKYRRELSYHLNDLELDMNLLTTSYILLEQLFTKKYNQGFLIFAQFVNNFLQQIVYCNFPSYSNFVSSILLDHRESNLILDVFLEKNIEDKSFIRDAYSFFMSLLLLDSFEESEYSQLGAKAKTMELAIQNVTETITILRIKYNKSRQAIITNEIIEILNATVAILE
jgi:F-type H+-transporting ATPase subunit gamma